MADPVATAEQYRKQAQQFRERAAAEADRERAKQWLEFAVQLAFAADILEPDQPAERSRMKNEGR